MTSQPATLSVDATTPSPLPPVATPATPDAVKSRPSVAVTSVASPNNGAHAYAAAAAAAAAAGAAAPHSSPHHHHHHHHTNNKNNKWKHQAPPPPTNCVVLKNLDYSITQSILEDVVRRVTDARNHFVNITLIDDKHTGTFRGMAFVNFRTTEDATAALAELSKMVINNRRVIAEYRRLRPGEKKEHDKRSKKYDNYNYNHRQTFEKHVQPQLDANGVAVDKRVAFFAKRDTARKDAQNKFELKTEKDKLRDAQFRALLVKYANDELQDSKNKDLVFDAKLTSYERKMVHHICDGLNLGHISRFDDGGNRMLYVTKDAQRAAQWEKEAMEAKTEARKLAMEQKRKARDVNVNVDNNNSDANAVTPNANELQGINWFKPRSAITAEGADVNGASGIRAPTFKTYVPSRKPKGPDGTVGFATRIALREKQSVQPDADEQSHVANGELEQHELPQTNGHQAESEGDADADASVNAHAEGTVAQAKTGVEAHAAEADSTTDTQGGEVAKSGNSVASPTKSGKGTHRVLNPSVPAFEPSQHTFY